MILPFLIPIFKGIQNWTKAPVTWAIFSAIIFIHVMLSEQVKLGNEKLDKYLSDPVFIKVQVSMFSNFVLRNKNIYSDEVVAMVNRRSQDPSLAYSLAIISIKDPRFMSVAPTTYASVDPIETNWWQEKVKEVQEIKKMHPVYSFAVHSNNKDFIPWLTYQFIHSNWEHLIINVFFLLIIGTYLERFIGGLLLLLVYLFSGFFAAGFTLLFSEFSLAPLIGASGSISGLMAFFSLLLWKRKVNFFYMLLIPVRGYSGVVKLPAWIFMFLWVIQDLKGYIGQTEFDGSSTAFIAHIGGAVCGALMVGIYIFVIRAKSYLINLRSYSPSTQTPHQ